MVSRTSAEPQGRPNKFTDVGVVGRKTGLMVKDTGRRDSAGLEDMDAFFSPTVEKSPRKSGVSPRGRLYRTKLQAAMQSDESVPMEGTSSSIRDPSEVLASRKSLLAQSRTPQKTFLKSPAVRVQTPKRTNLDSPSRVKRLISFTELDTDFENEDMNHRMESLADPVQSPTVTLRPARRKGLAQQMQRRGKEVEEEGEQEENLEEEVPMAARDDYIDEDEGGYEGGFGDDSLDFGQEEPEEVLDIPMDVIEETEAEEEPEELSEEELDEEEPTQPPAPTSRGRGRPSTKSKQKAATKSTKAKTDRQSKKSSSQPLPKRARTTSSQPRSPPRILERKEVPHPTEISADGDVRRSTRIRVPPLAHWKNERIVYELESRRASGPALPRIKEIVRIDTPPQPSRQRARSVGVKRKSRSDSDSESGDESDAGEVFASVKNYEDDSIIDDYKIAMAKRAIETQPLQGSKVRFEKCFQDGAYVACGVMDIAVGGAKGVKPTKHAFMSFAIMSGKVEVKVNRTAFVIGKGGVFVVPRGNFYSIKNVGNKDCRLFFSQAVQEVLPAPDNEEDD